MAVTQFQQKVYDALKRVPKGMVTTYKYLGVAIGSKAYRAIGTAMKLNPFAPDVPCHRVVASDGRIGGFMGHKTGPTIIKKIEMLSKENVTVIDNKVVNFEKILWKGK